MRPPAPSRRVGGHARAGHLDHAPAPPRLRDHDRAVRAGRHRRRHLGAARRRAPGARASWSTPPASWTRCSCARSGPATTRSCSSCRRTCSRAPAHAGIAEAFELPAARLHYFLINKGPWSRLDHNRVFIPGVPAKPEAANFYPAGATKDEVAEVARLAERRRQGARDRLLHDDPPRRRRAASSPCPTAIEYQGELALAAALLRDAAALTQRQPTLKNFLTARADAFLSNDYYASDVAWMELDAVDRADHRPVRGLRGRVVQLQGGVRGVHHGARRRGDEQAAGVLRRTCRRSRTRCRSTRSTATRRSARSRPIRVVNVVFTAGDGESRRPDRGVQPAERRARHPREGQQAGHAEEHAGREVQARCCCRSAKVALSPPIRRTSRSTPSSRTS